MNKNLTAISYVKLLKVNATVAFAVALSLRRIMWYNLV